MGLGLSPAHARFFGRPRAEFWRRAQARAGPEPGSILSRARPITNHTSIIWMKAGVVVAEDGHTAASKAPSWLTHLPQIHRPTVVVVHRRRRKKEKKTISMDLTLAITAAFALLFQNTTMFLLRFGNVQIIIWGPKLNYENCYSTICIIISIDSNIAIEYLLSMLKPVRIN